MMKAPSPSVAQQAIAQARRQAASDAAAAGDAMTALDVRVAALEAASGGGGASFETIEVNLGAKARRAGRFAIAGTGLTVGKPVLIHKAAGPYTGKGARADEAELDLISATGVVESATSIRVYWQAAGPVRGNFKFNYMIGA